VDGIVVELEVLHVPRGAFDPWQHQLDIDLPMALSVGQVLQVLSGDTDGWLAPTIACDTVDFLVALWRPRDPRWSLVGTTTAPAVIAGPAVRAVAVSGGDAVVGEVRQIHVQLQDAWGNATVPPDGIAMVEALHGVEHLHTVTSICQMVPWSNCAS